MAKARDYLSMCPQERFSLYKLICQAYPLLKRIGPLAAPQCYLLCLLLFYRCLYRKPLQSYLSVLAVIPCAKSLINTFRSSLGSILLLIENAAIDPLRLWVIKYRFLAPLPRSIALLVSEAGKEFLYRCFYFAIAVLCPYGQLSYWIVASGKRPTYVVVVPPPTEIVPYKIPAGIIDCVLANRYAGDRHPSEHLI